MSPARRTLARRSAFALAWSVAAFVAGQLALGLAVEHWLPATRDPEYAYQTERLRARCAEMPDRPLVLALGSSRVANGLRGGPADLGPERRPALVYNFGVFGSGPYLNNLLLRRLFAEGVRPDLLLLEVLPPAFNQPRDRPVEETWLDAARLRDAERVALAHYHTEPSRSLRQWLKGRVPCLWHRAHLHALLAAEPAADPGATNDPYGWSPVWQEISPEHRREHSAYARTQYAVAWGDFRLAPGPDRAMADALSACRQSNVPVALLLMPEGPTFRANYSPSMRAGLDDYLGAVSRRWGVPIIDARDWLPDDAFADSHHLTRDGAVAFSDRLEREALSPLLRDPPARR
ncbi:MAG TPA: hypothetical protein VFW33_07730 [Gemmataceae bacterium]|nr:hypothetical protein [Gemmataceae bacterium]